MGQTVVPGHVPQMVLRVVVARPPLGVVLAAVDAPHQALQEGSLVRAGHAGLHLDVGSSGRLVDGVDEAPGQIVSNPGVAGPQVGDVQLGHVELLVGDEHHDRDGALPGVGALHQPVQSLHRGLGGDGDPSQPRELQIFAANLDLVRDSDNDSPDIIRYHQ